MTGKEAIENARFFNLRENWGDPEKVHPELIMKLDKFRDYLGQKFHISPVQGAVIAGPDDGHAEQSWHLILPGRNDFAMAVDGFPEGDLVTAWILAIRMGFGGVGIYPYACYHKYGIQGMLHLDIRPTVIQSLWWRSFGRKYNTIASLPELAYLTEVLKNQLPFTK